MRIFIGYDRNETVAYHVLTQSILSYASVPLSFTPVALSGLSNFFTRERHSLQSTEFSFSRFLVPYLSGYQGWSLFIDCDIIFRDDVAKIFALKDEQHAVMACKHDYTPSSDVKFLKQVQTLYAKKNWSSVMLFNNSRCRALTPDYVNSATGLELHQFKWLGSDDEIGALPLEWNWLVSEYPHNTHAKAVHFTLGGPYFTEYADCDYADEWRAVLAQVQSVRQRNERS